MRFVRALATLAGIMWVHAAQVQTAVDRGFFLLEPGWHFLLVFPLTGVLAVIIHEAGHLAAAVAVGQRWQRFVVGRLEIGRDNGTWRVKLIPVRQVAGSVAAVPSTFANFRMQYAVVSAGGPFASYVSSALFLVMAMQADTALFYWIWSDCALWGMISLINLLPFRAGRYDSDGRRMWDAIRGGTAFDRAQAACFSASSHATSLRPRDWPHDVICRLVDAKSDSHNRRSDCYLAYVHALDSGDIDRAGRYLDRFTDACRAGDPPEYVLEKAYFTARHRKEGPAAAQWLAMARDVDGQSWVRLRACAAVEWATGNSEAARELAGEALASLKGAYACGAHQYEIDLLEELANIEVKGAETVWVGGEAGRE